MAYIINLKQNIDPRGTLVAIEDMQLPFKIKRVYNITKPSGIRGGHRHKKTIQAMICLSGSCVVYNNNNKIEEEFFLSNISPFSRSLSPSSLIFCVQFG